MIYREDWQRMGVSPLEVSQDAIVQDGTIRFLNTTFTMPGAGKLTPVHVLAD
jgi:hypothetical protein